MRGDALVLPGPRRAGPRFPLHAPSRAIGLPSTRVLGSAPRGRVAFALVDGLRARARAGGWPGVDPKTSLSPYPGSRHLACHLLSRITILGHRDAPPYPPTRPWEGRKLLGDGPCSRPQKRREHCTATLHRGPCRVFQRSAGLSGIVQGARGVTRAFACCNAMRLAQERGPSCPCRGYPCERFASMSWRLFSRALRARSSAEMRCLRRLLRRWPIPADWSAFARSG